MSVEQNNIKKNTYSDDLQSLLKSSKISILIVAGCFTILILIYHCRFGSGGWGDTTAFGTFGDYIGGLLNPLVAFLALIALWRATAIQTKFVKEQIEKDDERLLEQIKRENARVEKNDLAQQEQLKKDKEKLQRDLFSRNYDAYLKSIDAIIVDEEEHHFCSGKSALYVMYAKQGDHEILRNSIKNNRLEDIRNEENRFLHPVIRMMFQILTSQTKKKYKISKNKYNKITYENIKFFRAQLTAEELIFISLNILFQKEGQQGLAPFVKHFGLLKHLQIGHLRNAVEKMHGSDCFGKNHVSQISYKH